MTSHVICYPGCRWLACNNAIVAWIRSCGYHRQKNDHHLFERSLRPYSYQMRLSVVTMMTWTVGGIAEEYIFGNIRRIRFNIAYKVVSYFTEQRMTLPEEETTVTRFLCESFRNRIISSKSFHIIREQYCIFIWYFSWQFPTTEILIIQCATVYQHNHHNIDVGWSI